MAAVTLAWTWLGGVILMVYLVLPSTADLHTNTAEISTRQKCPHWNYAGVCCDTYNCVRRRHKRYYEGFKDPYGHPCTSYTRMNQPERRVGNTINQLTDSALCDRTLKRRWYRFEGPAGGIMPETCVDEFRCGTHAPIWLNGKHPQRYGEVKDIEVCLSLSGHCCNRRWFVRVANCDDYYTYLLPGTPGCFMAYCMGSELPCPPGQSSSTGFSPGCSDNFPQMDGQAALHMGQEGHRVVFFCDYEGPIPHDTVIDVEWYVQGDNSGPGDQRKFPVFTERMVERRRSILTEGSWNGKMGSSIFCRLRGRWKNETGVPSPATESDKYFAGIKILKRVVNVSESDMETEIQVQSTVPVGCLPQFKDACKVTLELAHDQDYESKWCQDGQVRQVVFGDCSIDITPDNWKDVHTVSVKAVRDFYYDGNKRMMVNFKPTFSTMVSPIWNNYELPQLEVIARDAPTQMCASTGDPHYSTFDSLYYHMYLEGEFVLYKNTRLPLQINTRLETCGNGVSCNCGVAVKAADDVIVIDRCMRRRRNLAFGQSFPEGWRTLHRHALEQGGDFVKGLKIYEYDGGKRFTVHMPTGAYVDFRVGDQWIDLFLYASSDDWMSTHGLCGTFDGKWDNDLLLSDGMTHMEARNNDVCGESADLCKFAESWRVQPKDSFFGPVVDVPLKEYQFLSDKQYCKCEQKKGSTTSTVTCNYHYDVDNCKSREVRQRGSDRTDDLVFRSRQSRSIDLHDEDDDYFNTEFIYDPNFVGKEPSWPTISGITEDTARQYCSGFIMDSPAGYTCNHIIRDKLSHLITACMTDIKVTDSLDWAQSALNAMTSECMDAIHVDAKYWENPYIMPNSEHSGEDTDQESEVINVQSDGDILLHRVCEGSCSNHGDCRNGVCECFQGHEGSDCSESQVKPPEIVHLSSGGLCDQKMKACKHIRVYGSHFRNVSTLTCHLQPVQVSETGVTTVGTVIEVPALFDTFEEVICRLPMNQGDTTQNGGKVWLPAYYVAVSNDEDHKTPQELWIAHHSDCLTCLNLGKKSTCSLKADVCYVGGGCFSEGDKDLDNCCSTCQPQLSQLAFSEVKGYPPPKISPWQSTYQVLKGTYWDMVISGKDTNGCDITYEIDNRPSSHIMAEIEADGIHVEVNTTKIGQHSVTVTLRSECGSSFTTNYHVIVLEKLQEFTPEEKVKPINCTDNHPPTFVDHKESVLNLTLVQSEHLEIQFQAQDLEQHNIEFLFLKDETTLPFEHRMSIAKEGLFRYKAPTKPNVDQVTLIAMDSCRATAFMDVFITTQKCNCRNKGTCQPDPAFPRGRGHYICKCVPPYGGKRCRRLNNS